VLTIERNRTTREFGIK